MSSLWGLQARIFTSGFSWRKMYSWIWSKILGWNLLHKLFDSNFDSIDIACIFSTRRCWFNIKPNYFDFLVTETPLKKGLNKFSIRPFWHEIACTGVSTSTAILMKYSALSVRIKYSENFYDEVRKTRSKRLTATQFLISIL